MAYCRIGWSRPTSQTGLVVQMCAHCVKFTPSFCVMFQRERLQFMRWGRFFYTKNREQITLECTLRRSTHQIQISLHVPNKMLTSKIVKSNCIKIQNFFESRHILYWFKRTRTQKKGHVKVVKTESTLYLNCKCAPSENTLFFKHVKYGERIIQVTQNKWTVISVSDTTITTPTNVTLDRSDTKSKKWRSS